MNKETFIFLGVRSPRSSVSVAQQLCESLQRDPGYIAIVYQGAEPVIFTEKFYSWSEIPSVLADGKIATSSKIKPPVGLSSHDGSSAVSHDSESTRSISISTAAALQPSQALSSISISSQDAAPPPDRPLTLESSVPVQGEPRLQSSRTQPRDVSSDELLKDGSKNVARVADDSSSVSASMFRDKPSPFMSRRFSSSSLSQGSAMTVSTSEGTASRPILRKSVSFAYPLEEHAHFEAQSSTPTPPPSEDGEQSDEDHAVKEQEERIIDKIIAENNRRASGFKRTDSGSLYSNATVAHLPLGVSPTCTENVSECIVPSQKNDELSISSVAVTSSVPSPATTASGVILSPSPPTPRFLPDQSDVSVATSFSRSNGAVANMGRSATSPLKDNTFPGTQVIEATGNTFDISTINTIPSSHPSSSSAPALNSFGTSLSPSAAHIAASTSTGLACNSTLPSLSVGLSDSNLSVEAHGSRVVTPPSSDHALRNSSTLHSTAEASSTHMSYTGAPPPGGRVSVLNLVDDATTKKLDADLPYARAKISILSDDLNVKYDGSGGLSFSLLDPAKNLLPSDYVLGSVSSASSSSALSKKETLGKIGTPLKSSKRYNMNSFGINGEIGNGEAIMSNESSGPSCSPRSPLRDANTTIYPGTDSKFVSTRIGKDVRVPSPRSDINNPKYTALLSPSGYNKEAVALSNDRTTKDYSSFPANMPGSSAAAITLRDANDSAYRDNESLSYGTMGKLGGRIQKDSKIRSEAMPPYYDGNTPRRTSLGHSGIPDDVAHDLSASVKEAATPRRTSLQRNSANPQMNASNTNLSLSAAPKTSNISNSGAPLPNAHGTPRSMPEYVVERRSSADQLRNLAGHRASIQHLAQSGKVKAMGSVFGHPQSVNSVLPMRPAPGTTQPQASSSSSAKHPSSAHSRSTGVDRVSYGSTKGLKVADMPMKGDNFRQPESRPGLHHTMVSTQPDDGLYLRNSSKTSSSRKSSLVQSVSSPQRRESLEKNSQAEYGPHAYHRTPERRGSGQAKVSSSPGASSYAASSIVGRTNSGAIPTPLGGSGSTPRDSSDMSRTDSSVQRTESTTKLLHNRSGNSTAIARSAASDNAAVLEGARETRPSRRGVESRADIRSKWNAMDTAAASSQLTGKLTNKGTASAVCDGRDVYCCLIKVNDCD